MSEDKEKKGFSMQAKVLMLTLPLIFAFSAIINKYDMSILHRVLFILVAGCVISFSVYGVLLFFQKKKNG